MSYRKDAVAIALLKTASQGSKALEAGKRLAHIAKGVTTASADFGGGLASGLGLPKAVGQAAGVTALGTGAVIGGRKVKRKADELKFRLMYGDQSMYY